MKVKINGINIDYNFYEVEDSPTIVFVHGFPFNQKMWNPQVEALKGKCSILTYDGRGLGESETGDGQFMFENLVDDFIELLRNLKIGKVVACGLSMGGYIILRAYEKQPSMFHALILCDTRAEADGNEAKLRRAQMLHILKFHGKEKFADEFIKTVLSPKTFEEKKEIVTFVYDMITQNNEIGIAGNLIALATRTDTTHIIEKIDVPVLIVVGEDDALTPPSLAQSLHAKIKNSQIVVIPSAGHLSNVENSEKFNEAIISFLNRICPT
ncbi:MAG: alpha/beta fold hydrolase [Candidatus Kryptonium sp.]